MSREYLSIRLSYEAKVWLLKLQVHVQETLDACIHESENNDMENLLKQYLKSIADTLAGVSVTNILKVSASSIIEEAYNYTIDYSLTKWQKTITKMDNCKVDPNLEIGTLTPRLYLKSDVIEGLEGYQHTFKKENMVRNAKLSYVIKVVLYAYYLYEIKE